MDWCTFNGSYDSNATIHPTNNKVVYQEHRKTAIENTFWEKCLLFTFQICPPLFAQVLCCASQGHGILRVCACVCVRACVRVCVLIVPHTHLVATLSNVCRPTNNNPKPTSLLPHLMNGLWWLRPSPWPTEFNAALTSSIVSRFYCVKNKSTGLHPLFSSTQSHVPSLVLFRSAML